MVNEVCPNCESEVTMIWDVKKRGYRAFCPVCGGRLMLCDECIHNDGVCDYSGDSDSCSRMKGGSKI